MSQAKNNKNRKEYWMHKLKSEVQYTPTQKNERAINEFAEDIAQYIELVNSKEEKISDKLYRNEVNVKGWVEANTEKTIRDITLEIKTNRMIHYVTWGGIALLFITMGLLKWL